jgi:hypothetical protein
MGEQGNIASALASTIKRDGRSGGAANPRRWPPQSLVLGNREEHPKPPHTWLLCDGQYAALCRHCYDFLAENQTRNNWRWSEVGETFRRALQLPWRAWAAYARAVSCAPIDLYQELLFDLSYVAAVHLGGVKMSGVSRPRDPTRRHKSYERITLPFLAISEYRRPFGMAILAPLEWPWSSAQRRTPLPAQARKREGARYPDRAPFLMKSAINSTELTEAVQSAVSSISKTKA